MRVCEGTGQWSDSMPQCIRKLIFLACFILETFSELYSAAINCGDLPAPSNGQVNIDNGTMYPIGEATYRCDGGYELVGIASRFCLFNGRWSGGDPMCRRK